MKKELGNKILSSKEIRAKIERIAHEIHESCYQEKSLTLVGISGKGFDFAKRLHKIIEREASFDLSIQELKLNKDKPLSEDIVIKNCESLKNNAVVLIDDVLNSGKTLAYAVSFILQHEPKMLKTAILVNREHHRYPITADFVGLSLATTLQEHIKVVLGQSDGAYLQ